VQNHNVQTYIYTITCSFWMTEECVIFGVLFMVETSPVRWNRCKHL